MTTTAESRDPVRSGRARRRLLVLLPVVALVLGAALWWWSHPRAFGEPAGIGIVPGEPGRPLFLGMLHPGATDVSLIDVSPRVLSDSAGAQVTVHVCRLVDRYSAVGSAYDHVDDSCAALRAPVGPLEATDQLVVEVVAQEEGDIVIDGLDVVYRTGVQRGTEWTGMHETIEVGPPGTTP